MDVECSLTPPDSPPIVDDDRSRESSPVLVSKTHSRGQIDKLIGFEDVHGEQCRRLQNYPQPVLCQPPVNDESYGVHSCHESTHISRAYEFWNSLATLSVMRDSHDCMQCSRSVMGQKICLNDLVNSDCDFFYQVLLYFQDLEEMVEWSKRCVTVQNINDVNIAKKFGKDINEALLFICEFVQNCADEETSADVLVNIFGLMMMLVNQMQAIVLNGLKFIVRADIEISDQRKISPVHEWLHCFVQVHVTLLKLLPIMTKWDAVLRHIDSTQVIYDNGVEVADGSFHIKILRYIFSSVMKMALEKYIQLQRASKMDKGHFMESTLVGSSPFPCLCVQQLGSLCLHVGAQMEWNRSFTQCDSESMEILRSDSDGRKLFDSIIPLFWNTMSSFIHSVIQDTQATRAANGPPGPSLQQLDSVQDALSFCWWWTWHAAHLFSFDKYGQYQKKSSVSSSYMPLLSRLLRLSKSNCADDRKLMTCHLMYYQAIASFWRSNSQHLQTVSPGELAHVHLLWNYFSKKLNETTKSDGIGMHKYMLKDDKSISPRSWITKCDKYLKYESGVSADKLQAMHADPFKAFMSIFGELVSLGYWDAIKNKFFSSILQANEMKTLTDDGLSRLFQLFLLILSSDMHNDERLIVFKKLMDCLNSTSLSKTDYRKLKVMMNGLFACMHLALEHTVKLPDLAAKCGKIISWILKSFSENGRNLEQRSSLWKIAAFYFQNLSHIFQISKSFLLCQDMLLPAIGVQSALSKAKANEAIAILESISAIFSTLRCHIQHSVSRDTLNNCVSMISATFNFFLPWLQELSKTEESIAEEISSVAIAMCNIKIEILISAASTPLPFKLCDLVKCFGSCIETKLRTRFLFLVGILSEENSVLLKYLHSSGTESNLCSTTIIQGSLKCFISHPSKKDQDDLMRCLLQLSVFRNIMNNAENSDENHFMNFLRALEIRYHSAKTFVDRKEQKDEVASWFNPISEVMVAFTKSYASDDLEVVMNLYHKSAYIALHCSRVLYTSGKRGIIIQVFDTLLLPRWIYGSQDKVIHPTLLKALNQTLHLFVKSLLHLDYKRDGYLRRVLTETVGVYLTRFPAATNAISHPFRRTLADVNLAAGKRCDFLKTLKEQCETGPNMDTKLTVVIEVLYSWMEQLKGGLKEGEVASILPLLERAKRFLRSLPTIMNKVNCMHAICQQIDVPPATFL